MSKQQFYLLGAAVVVAGIAAMFGLFSSSSKTAEWVEEAKLFPKDGTFHEGFGTAVAMDGNTAIVGGPGRGRGSSSARRGSSSAIGATYIYMRSGSTWSRRAKWLYCKNIFWRENFLKKKHLMQ